MSVLYRRATLEARKLEQSLVFLEDTFGSVEKSDTGEPVSVHSLLDEAVHWIAIALDGEPEVEASIRITLGNGYRGLGLFDDARRQLLRARDLHEQHPPSDEHPDHARSLNALGLLYRDLGRLERAEEYFRSALEVRKRAFGESSVRTSASYQNLASIATRRRDIPRATELLGTAHALRSTHYGDEHPNTAMTVFQLAESYAGLLQWDDSLERHETALAVRRKTLHPAHPDIVRSLEAIAAVEKTRGSSHPWTARLESRIPELLEKGDLDE